MRYALLLGFVLVRKKEIIEPFYGKIAGVFDAYAWREFGERGRIDEQIQ